MHVPCAQTFSATNITALPFSPFLFSKSKLPASSMLVHQRRVSQCSVQHAYLGFTDCAVALLQVQRKTSWRHSRCDIEERQCAQEHYSLQSAHAWGILTGTFLECGGRKQLPCTAFVIGAK